MFVEPINIIHIIQQIFRYCLKELTEPFLLEKVCLVRNRVLKLFSYCIFDFTPHQIKPLHRRALLLAMHQHFLTFPMWFGRDKNFNFLSSLSGTYFVILFSFE